MSGPGEWAKRAADVAPPVRRLREDRNRLAAEVGDLRARLAAAEQEAADARAAVAVCGIFPPGHFYSPIPSRADLETYADLIWRERTELPGIDLRAAEQLALLPRLADAAATVFRSGEGRYNPVNDQFSWKDGVTLAGMLALHRPPRVVEVGSGWSSALTLDVRDRLPDWDPELTFVEPYPARLESLLRPGDEHGVTIHTKPVQDVDPNVITRLEAGDLLFIDSTHVSRAGSDVNVLLLDLVPRLRPGVLVQVHDVFWPFEYPRDWLDEGRFWNEDYVLRALLVGNPSLRIVWFNAWLDATHHDAVSARFADWDRNPGGSLWLETVQP
ncbi:MAG: hypothetical protein QOE45_2704 [Frankiaceae bacterium]|jgi:hypothetical protein|nr:hypothetical protein [Frankiaceae bacterium]